MDQQNQQEQLIHLPVLSLDSLLAERNHPLSSHQDLWDVDARELFQDWAVRNGFVAASGRNSSLIEDADDSEGRRRRRLQDIIGDGTHFIKLYVGNPAQLRVLALSSAADLTAWPCEDCYNCGNLIQPFIQSRSNTFSTMPCGRCATGTASSDACDDNREQCVVTAVNRLDSASAWTAYESRDYIYVGGADEESGGMEPVGSDVAERFGFPLVFGCQTEATGWYSTQVHDGIAGLSSAKTSFVNQMVFQDKLQYPRFTMCFVKGTTDGLVTLGGFNPKTLDTPMAYVQNVEPEGSTGFKVFVRNVYLRKSGGQSIVSDGDGTASSLVKLNFDAEQFNSVNKGTVIDSGLPLLVLDESIQETFLTEWKRMTGSDFSLGKMRLTESDILSLPTLVFQIKAHDGVDKSFNPNTFPSLAGDRDPENPFDVMIAIPATHYLEFIPATGTYRSKITLGSTIGSFIGMVGMEGHSFYYDLTSDRIGIAESFKCQPNSGLSGFGDDDLFALPSMGGADPWGYDPNGPGGWGSGGDRGVGTLSTAHYDQQGGNCTSATCISFVTVGYAAVLVALAAAFQKYRPRDQSKKFEESTVDDSDTVFGENEKLNPSFRQHVRHGDVEGLA